MKKQSLAAFALSAAALCSGAVSATDQYELANRANYAGLYLQVPFGKSDHIAHKQTRFGLRAGWRQDIARSYQPGALRSFDANFVDLSFTSKGFDRFSFAGAPLVHQTEDGLAFGLNADGDGKSGGTNAWPWIFGIAAVGGLTAIVVAENYDGGCIRVPAVTICD